VFFDALVHEIVVDEKTGGHPREVRANESAQGFK
jgi:hypothetical protein